MNENDKSNKIDKILYMTFLISFILIIVLFVYGIFTQNFEMCSYDSVTGAKISCSSAASANFSQKVAALFSYYGLVIIIPICVFAITPVIYIIRLIVNYILNKNK